MFITERERLLWRSQGLPADTESLVGVSCALRGPLVPMFIDPSGMACAWLKRNLGGTLEVTRPMDSKFLTTLELAMRFGKPLLIEEIVDLPAVLLPLLRLKPLKLGDRTLPAQPGFKLFLVTRSERLPEGFPREADALLVKVSLGSGVRSLAERLVDKVSSLIPLISVRMKKINSLSLKID